MGGTLGSTRGEPRACGLGLAIAALLSTAFVPACTPADAARVQAAAGPDWCEERGSSAAPATAASAPRPNVIIVLTDDQRHDSVEHMPVAMDRLADEGLRFSNGFVPTPLCGPSRASLLTGRYAHQHGVIGNDVRFFDPSTTIATQLQAAGYATGLFGKYMNLYDQIEPEAPPGWDVWRAYTKGAYYDYSLVEDGQVVAYGDGDEDYSTDVLAGMALDFIDAHHRRPFFLMLSTWAPHTDAEGAPRHVGSFDALPPWRPPSFEEEDDSDKPAFVRWVRSLQTAAGPEVHEAIVEARDASQRRQLESLLAVDEAIGEIIDRLERYRIADDTLIVFTSDNGLHWGEHWLSGKYDAYEESIRVPLLIRYPRMVDPARVEEGLVLNIDLAPTIAELAGISEPGEMDGSSLAGILCGDAGDAEPREDFLLEYFTPRSINSMPAYSGVRGERWKYVRYITGFEELFDLEADPAEMDNLLVTLAGDAGIRALADELAARMAELEAEPSVWE